MDGEPANKKRATITPEGSYDRPGAPLRESPVLTGSSELLPPGSSSLHRALSISNFSHCALRWDSCSLFFVVQPTNRTDLTRPFSAAYGSNQGVNQYLFDGGEDIVGNRVQVTTDLSIVSGSDRESLVVMLAQRVSALLEEKRVLVEQNQALTAENERLTAALLLGKEGQPHGDV